MGVDYYAKAIIGIKVDPLKLYTVKTVKAFKHNYDETFLFDPKTGKPLWVEEETPIDGYDGDDKFGEFNVTSDTDQKNAYIGLITKTSSSRSRLEEGFVELPDMEKLREKM